jgi:hypothetical protein
MRSVRRQPSGDDHTAIHIVEAMPWRGADMQRAAFMRWRNSAEVMTWTRITGTRLLLTTPPSA